MASIRVRGKQKRIYLQFRYSNRQMQEPTPYTCEHKGEKDCKCRGCVSARRYAGEIDRKIDENTFDLADYFPNSKALKVFGGVCVDENIPFGQYARQWLDLKKAVVSFSTHKGYKKQVNALISMLNLDLRHVRPAHIRNAVKMMSDRGLKPKTIKNTVYMASDIFAQATEDKIIAENPCAGVKLPKIVKVPPDPFDASEVGLILDEMKKAHPDWAAYFAIGFFTGMRTGEIMALTWEDIDFNAHTITVDKTMTEGRLKLSTKTGVSHKVDIVEQLDPYLLKHKEFTFLQGGELFRTETGEPVQSYNRATSRWRTALKKLGIRYRIPYQMRHTFATMMLAAGENPKWVAEMLGHTDLQMLFKVYGNWYKPEEGRRAGAKFQSFVAKRLPSQK